MEFRRVLFRSVFFRVFRDATAGADNLAVDARLHGVVLFITLDASGDS